MTIKQIYGSIIAALQNTKLSVSAASVQVILQVHLPPPSKGRVPAWQRLWYLLWLLLCSNESKPAILYTEQTDCRAKSDAFTRKCPAGQHCWLVVVRVAKATDQSGPPERNLSHIQLTDLNCVFPAACEDDIDRRAAALIISNSIPPTDWLTDSIHQPKSTLCQQSVAAQTRDEKGKHLCCLTCVTSTWGHYTLCACVICFKMIDSISIDAQTVRFISTEGKRQHDNVLRAIW